MRGRYWCQSRDVTGASSHSLPMPLPALVLCRSQSGGATGLSPCSLLIPVPLPDRFQFIAGPGAGALLVPVRGRYWSRSLFPVGSALLSLLVPVPALCRCPSRLQLGAGPGPRALLVPVRGRYWRQSPLPTGSTDLRSDAGSGRGARRTGGGGEGARPRRARPGPGTDPVPGTAGPPPWPGDRPDSATMPWGQRGDTGWDLGLAAGSAVMGSG